MLHHAAFVPTADFVLLSILCKRFLLGVCLSTVNLRKRHQLYEYIFVLTPHSMRIREAPSLFYCERSLYIAWEDNIDNTARTWCCVLLLCRNCTKHISWALTCVFVNKKMCQCKGNETHHTAILQSDEMPSSKNMHWAWIGWYLCFVMLPAVWHVVVVVIVLVGVVLMVWRCWKHNKVCKACTSSSLKYLSHIALEC